MFAPATNANGYRPYVRTSRIGDPRYDPDNNPNYSCEGCGVPVEVRLYNRTDAFVLDERDAEQAADIEAMGLRVRVINTLMRDAEVAARVAEAELALAKEPG